MTDLRRSTTINLIVSALLLIASVCLVVFGFTQFDAILANGSRSMLLQVYDWSTSESIIVGNMYGLRATWLNVIGISYLLWVIASVVIVWAAYRFASHMLTAIISALLLMGTVFTNIPLHIANAYWKSATGVPYISDADSLNAFLGLSELFGWTSQRLGSLMASYGIPLFPIQPHYLQTIAFVAFAGTIIGLTILLIAPLRSKSVAKV